MSYQEIVAADIRLSILAALEQDPAYSHNEYVLGSVLGAVGHAIGRDRLRTELAWLAEQGLITLEAGSDIQVAKLTARGEDVALGRARVPGVKRPGPR